MSLQISINDQGKIPGNNHASQGEITMNNQVNQGEILGNDKLAKEKRLKEMKVLHILIRIYKLILKNYQ